MKRESRYEVVILDLSEAVDGWYELLDECSGVYTPVEPDETAKAKMRQYEETMKLLELEEVLERTQKLELSACDGLELLVKVRRKKVVRAVRKDWEELSRELRKRVQEQLDLSQGAVG